MASTTPVPAPEPEPEAPAPAPVVVNEETMRLVKERQREFKVAAVAWKKAGNNEEAINLVKISKQFDAVVEAIAAGNPVDLSDMPPSPSLPIKVASDSQQSNEEPGKMESETQHEPPAPPPPGEFLSKY